MGTATHIQWTEHTWNPWRGCTKISPGCAHCYMFTEQSRWGQNPAVVTRTKTWNEPKRWQQSAEERGVYETVFTCSWSDWFHEAADPWRDEAWSIIRSCPNLKFQILTKRPERMFDHLPADWHMGYPNVWLGVSVENVQYGVPRIKKLQAIPAQMRFLSVEPLLEPIESLPLELIDWVIIGGESGPMARPCHIEWIENIIRQCQDKQVKVFVKQLGAYPVCNKKRLTLKDRKGGDFSTFPDALQIREFPI